MNESGVFVTDKKPRRRETNNYDGMIEPPAGQPWRCRWCDGSDSWRSKWKANICRRCSPPAAWAEVAGAE